MRAGVRAFTEELDRIKHNLHQAPSEHIRLVAEHLARPREAIIQTSRVYACMANDEANKLSELFAYYIHHSFAKNQPEEQLTQQIVAMVKSFRLAQPFCEAQIGNQEYRVSFPLVQKQAEQVHKIIKPIYLGQDDAAALYQKADSWLARFKRLRLFGWINQKTKILLPYQAPNNQSNLLDNALNHVLSDFRQQGILAIRQDEHQELKRFIQI